MKSFILHRTKQCRSLLPRFFFWKKRILWWETSFSVSHPTTCKTVLISTVRNTSLGLWQRKNSVYFSEWLKETGGLKCSNPNSSKAPPMGKGERLHHPKKRWDNSTRQELCFLFSVHKNKKNQNRNQGPSPSSFSSFSSPHFRYFLYHRKKWLNLRFRVSFVLSPMCFAVASVHFFCFFDCCFRIIGLFVFRVLLFPKQRKPETWCWIYNATNKVFVFQ